MFPFQTLDQIERELDAMDCSRWLEQITTELMDDRIGAEAEIRLLKCIAGNTYTPQYILDMLADHHDATIRCSAAKNISKTYHTTVKLSNDCEKNVRDIIRACYGIPLA